MEQINKFYGDLLGSLGLAVEGSRVVQMDEDGSKEVTVNDKVLILPTREAMMKYSSEKEIPFHPLCENTLRGESVIQQELMILVRSSLNIRLAALIWRLVKVAGAGMDNKLNPSQAEFLPSLVGFDKDMGTRFGKLIKQVDPSQYKTSLIHLNHNRRCKIGDHKFERVCLVRFPLADATRDEKPYSVLRVKDFDALKNLMSYILPDWDLENTYSVGTDTKVAPYFTCLVQAYYQINKRISEIASNFVELFPEFAPLVIDDSEWWGQMGNLSMMRDTLPSYESSEGSLPKGGENQAPAIGDPTPAKGINMPLPKSKAEPVDVPWDEPEKKIAAQIPSQSKTVEDDVVEYVPRQQPQHGSIPMHQQQYHQPVVPAGYGQPQPQGNLTFHQLQQQRMASTHGYHNPQAYVAPVGGSPFAGNGQAPVHPAPVNPVYNNGYGQPAGGHIPVAPGRGF